MNQSGRTRFRGAWAGVLVMMAASARAGDWPAFRGPAGNEMTIRMNIEATVFSRWMGLAVLLVLPLPGAPTMQAEDWPQWRGPNRNGVWNETGIVESFPPGGLKVRWRQPVGTGWSSPVVAQGRVFLTDAQLQKPSVRERVHCFEEATGKPLWTYTYEVTTQFRLRWCGRTGS